MPLIHQERVYGTLLLFVLLGLLVHPVVRGYELIEELNYSLLAITLAAGVRIVTLSRWIELTIAALLIINLGLHWTLFFSPGFFSHLTAQILQLAFLGFTATAITLRLLTEENVTTDMVLGGVIGYLLIGLVLANCFQLVELLHPGSYLVQGVQTEMQLDFDGGNSMFLYFSFTTLTTLGYGDIVPAPESLAQPVAMMGAIVGQLYPAILVARLVALNLKDS